MTSTQDIIDLLKEIGDDQNATKNIKAKIESIVAILRSDIEFSLKINKASHELDELASKSDIDSYTRTQLMGIVGALETVEED